MVLEDLTICADKEACECIICIILPGPVMQGGGLIPRTRDSQSLRSHKVPEKKFVLATGILYPIWSQMDGALKKPSLISVVAVNQSDTKTFLAPTREPTRR